MRTENLSQKYFVNKNSQLSIQCLACKKSRTIPIETLRGKQHSIKVRCPCNNTFIIDIEFRNYHRKKVNFTGNYRLANAPVEEIKGCTVKDISVGGLSIKIINDSAIKESDVLIINFKIDDKNQHEIEKKIKVRHTDTKNKIGGEFIESENGEQRNELSFYLL